MAGYRATDIDLGEVGTPAPAESQGNVFKTFAELANYLGVDPNNPTPESQKIVADWLKNNPEYESGPVTNKYMEGYEEPPTNTPIDPADNLTAKGYPSSQEGMQAASNVTGNLRDRGYPSSFDSWTPRSPAKDMQEDTAVPQETTPASNNAGQLSSAVENGINGAASAIAAWTPRMPSANSVLAAGARDQSAQYAQNAAQNQKIMQWQKQRATDERLADKIAAAEAAGKWKQNANALGAEGGASVVAATNETVTPDIMAQKNYQTQQMQNAQQSLAEVNRNKLESIGTRTNADVVDANTAYQESVDENARNLSKATGSTEKKDNKSNDTSTDTKQNESKEGNTPASETEADTQGSVAPTNQESDAVEEATDQAVVDQVDMENILNGVGGYDWTHDYYKALEELKNKDYKTGKPREKPLEFVK